MPAVIGREIDAVGLVVGGDDDAAAIEDVVFAQVLLIDAQRIGRRGGVGLHVIVKLEAVELAQIARLADPQDHRLQEAVEPPQHLLRRHLLKIPGPDRVFDRLEQRVLADPLLPAENKRVVDLLLRSLHPVRKPIDDVVGLVRVNQPNVIEPSVRPFPDRPARLSGPIEIETCDATAFDPAALKDELVAYRSSAVPGPRSFAPLARN